MLDVGGDGLGLGDLLGLQAVALEHVLEVHVAADVELVGAVQHDAAVLEQLGHDPVGDGGADLALDVVTDDRHAGGLELRGPLGVGGDEDRQGVDEGDARVDGALGVVLVGDLGAHRQVGHEHVDLGVLERLDDVDRLGVGLLDGQAVVLAEAVVGHAALHGHAGRRDVGDLDGVVLGGVDRLGQVEADLLGVDVERGDELHVVDVVVPELDVHQPGHLAARVGVLVVLDALHQRAGAVADADDGDAHGSHGVLLRKRGMADGQAGPAAGLPPGGGSGGCAAAGGVRVAPAALGLDQLLEPADLALGGVQAVPLQLGGVEVHALAAPGRGGPDRRPAAPRAGCAGPRGCAAGPRPRCGRRTRSARRRSRPPRRPGRTGRSGPGTAPCRRP